MKKTQRPAIYLFSLAAVLLAGLAALEFAARQWGQYGGPNNNYLFKLYNEKRTNVVFGDSHVGNNDWLGHEFAFLGNGGMSLYEQLQAAKFYFRDKKPGKIMIETGPQLFSRTHDQTWRTFPADSFGSGPLAVTLYMSEPLFVQGSVEYLGSIARGLFDFSKANAQTRSEKKGTKSPEFRRNKREASRISRKLQNEGGHNFDYSKVPNWAREKIISEVARRYLPNKDFQDRIAWQSLVELVQFLTSRGAEVCLVRVAVTDELEKQMLFGKNRAANKATRRAVARLATQEKIQYVDYLSLKNRFPISYFRNQDHLNANGARVYWESARSACFDGNTRQRARFDTVNLHDIVMANHDAGKFPWWDVEESGTIKRSEVRNYYPLTVEDNRRAWELSAENIAAATSFSKTISVTGNSDIIAGLNTATATQAKPTGKVRLSLSYFRADGSKLQTDEIAYTYEELLPQTHYKKNKDQNWSGIVLRSKAPRRAKTARLEIAVNLGANESVLIDNFYMMSSGKVTDLTREMRDKKNTKREKAEATSPEPATSNKTDN